MIPLLFYTYWTLSASIFHIRLIDSRAIDLRREARSTKCSHPFYIPGNVSREHTPSASEYLLEDTEDPTKCKLQSSKKTPVKVTGEQSLSPLPIPKLSTRATGKRKRPANPDGATFETEETQSQRRAQTIYQGSIMRGRSGSIAEESIRSLNQGIEPETNIPPSLEILPSGEPGPLPPSFFTMMEELDIDWDITERVKQNPYYEHNIVYKDQQGGEAGSRVVLRSRASKSDGHFVVVWGGYSGSIVDTYTSGYIGNMPDLLYLLFSSQMEGPNSNWDLKYMSIIDITNPETIQVAMEVRRRLEPTEQGQEAFGMRFQDIHGLSDTNAKMRAWLALYGIPEVLIVSRMLASHSIFNKGSQSLDIFGIHFSFYDIGEEPKTKAALLFLEFVVNRQERVLIEKAYRESIRRGKLASTGDSEHERPPKSMEIEIENTEFEQQTQDTDDETEAQGPNPEQEVQDAYPGSEIQYPDFESGMQFNYPWSDIQGTDFGSGVQDMSFGSEIQGTDFGSGIEDVDFSLFLNLDYGLPDSEVGFQDLDMSFKPWPEVQDIDIEPNTEIQDTDIESDTEDAEGDTEQQLVQPQRRPEDLRNDLYIDYSWSGGQEYPFASWINVEGKHPWRSQEVFLKSGRSYRKVHLKRKYPWGGDRTILWATASAKDRHLAYIWSRDLHAWGDVSNMMYHCWITGSANHPDPNSHRTQSHIQPEIREIPPVALKYITIWDIHESETIAIFQTAFLQRFPYVQNTPDDQGLREHLASRALYVTPNDHKRNANIPDVWSAILGTVELLEIHQMCLKYSEGMRGARIRRLELMFQPSGPTDLPRASIIVELTEGRFRQRQPQSKEDDDLKTAALAKVEYLNLKRLRVQLSHSGFQYHPFQSIMREMISFYRPSENPSYLQVRVFEALESSIQGSSQELEDPKEEPYTGYHYDFAISSQEGHIFFGGVYNSWDEADRRIHSSPRNSYFGQHLGKIILSTWFAQEGWGKISDISFGKASAEAREFIKVLLDTELLAGNFISIPNDGGGEFYEILSAFLLQTPEGQAVSYIHNFHAEFLFAPDIQALHFIGYGTEGDIFIFIAFGLSEFVVSGPSIQGTDQSGSVNQGAGVAEPGSQPISQIGQNDDIRELMERLLHHGIQSGRAHDILTRNIILLWENSVDLGGNPFIHQYGPKDYDTFLSQFIIHDTGEIQHPLASLPQALLNRFKRNRHLVKANHYVSTISRRPKHDSDIEPTFKLAVSRDAGNIVVMQLPKEPLTRRDFITSMTDALYTTWIKYESEKVTKSDLNFRLTTLLVFTPQTRRLIDKLRADHQAEVEHSGFVVFRDPISTQELKQVDGTPKCDLKVPFTTARARIWFMLLGTPEIAAGHPEHPVVLVSMLDGGEKDRNNNAYRSRILRSKFKEYYLLGDAANFCDRYCGLLYQEQNPPQMDENLYGTREIDIEPHYKFDLIPEQSWEVSYFPWSGTKSIFLQASGLEACKDYFGILISHRPTQTEWTLRISQSTPSLSSLMDEESAKTFRHMRYTLAAIYFTAWNHRPLKEPLSSPGPYISPHSGIQYISIERLCEDTVEVINFVATLWKDPNSRNGDPSKKKVAGPLVLSRSSLYKTQVSGVLPWSLLLGTLEIGAIADMIVQYSEAMVGQRIETISIWTNSKEDLQVLVGIGPPTDPRHRVQVP
ncbi:hypothetical protein TWF730_010443 [Orbilia blumenaviensis]|uniref:Uncharacterized protein n=1 Tax=Orbilia blumenaviensis TaxID=1796055 RepID=A0AAV9US45_9PEZI